MAYNPNAIWKSTKDERESIGAGNPGSPEPAPPPKDAPAVKDEATSAKPEEKEVAAVKTPVSQAGSPPPPSKKVMGTAVFNEEPSFFTRHKLMIFTVGLLVVIGFIALVFYLILPPSAPSVTLAITEPESIPVGVPFEISVVLTDTSKSDLHQAALELTLPADLSFVGQNSSQRAMDETVGDLTAGAASTETFDVIATGNPLTVETVSAKLLYQAGSDTKYQFEADKTGTFTTGEPAVAISYNAPSNIFSGQSFPITVNYINNSTDLLNGMELSMSYPPAFVFNSASVKPVNASGTIYALGNLPPNATGTVTIMGTIVGPSTAQYQVTGALTAAFSGQDYGITSQSTNFLVTAEPLSVSISVNNSSSYVAAPGQTLIYTLSYANNANITFQNLAISAQLASSLFDLSSIKTNGSFNSRNDVILWNGGSDSQLLSLAPGQSGKLTFSVNLLGSFPAQSTDNVLKVVAGIMSPTVIPGAAGTSTASTVSLTNKVAGQPTFAATGYRYETLTGIANSGPYPPRVNYATTYTIHWAVTNSASALSNVTVSGYLQSGATFTGKETSNVSTTPTYNPANGLVTWTIPSLPANKQATAVFQISDTPSVNEVGQPVTLIGQSSFSGTDTFTSSTISMTSGPITTDLPNDARADSAATNRDVTQ